MTRNVTLYIVFVSYFQAKSISDMLYHHLQDHLASAYMPGEIPFQSVLLKRGQTYGTVLPNPWPLRSTAGVYLVFQASVFM